MGVRQLNENDLLKFEINGSFTFGPSAIVTAPTLNSNTNNLLIPDLKDKSVIYFLTDGNNRQLTGIDAAGLVDGQTFFFYNIGINGDISFRNNNSNSLAPNRFIMDGNANYKTGMGGILTYDFGSQRFRVNYFK